MPFVWGTQEPRLRELEYCRQDACNGTFFTSKVLAYHVATDSLDHPPPQLKKASSISRPPMCGRGKNLSKEKT